MAKTPARSAQTKQPGRVRQIWQVLRMTVKYDRAAAPLFLAAFLLPVLLAVLFCVLLYAGNVLMWILTVLLGLMTGFLLFMFALNWRAERVAFSQIEGHPGAAGQVLGSTLRGQWQSSETPAAFNPKTRDALYRVVGRPGVVLVTEGGRTGAKKLFQDERRKIQRLAPNVPITHVHIGSGEDEVPLLRLRRTLRRLPKKITKPEVLAISTRLNSMPGNALPIPKGIDPMRVRSSRSRLR
ncbi:MAG: DUF4191 domain-containing protein [Pseudoclavibacter sp.]|nr:DUF4191 domain-containing protein [Pseudoclavibacter sp.]